jgi:tryptophanyl-tRNA synthetase
VRLQEQYDCFYFVADWHALTSEFADTTRLTSNAWENVADWIGAGLDPEKCTFFIQSLVPEHAELYLLLSMVVPVPWLERVPTYKEHRKTSRTNLSSIGLRISAAAGSRRRHARALCPSAKIRSPISKSRGSRAAVQ